MRIHFRVYNDYSMLDTKYLQMYLQDNDGNIFVLKDIVFEKYKRGTCIEPINRICNDIQINETDLKRMSKELWSELDDDSAYLKGELKATKEHLEDMRTLVFAEKNRVIEEINK